MQPGHRQINLPARQRGFTIVEIMIALVLVGILLTGLVELFVTSGANARATDTLARIQENGRVSIQMLTADIRRAGYKGGVPDPDQITGSLPPVNGALSCRPTDTTWGRMIDQPVFGLNDTDNGYVCLTPAQHLRGDVLTTRFTASWPIATADMVPGRLYLRTSELEGRTFIGSQQGFIINRFTDISSENVQMFSHAYYVGPSGRTCKGEPIPSLFRKTLSDLGRPVSEELVPGVEHLQFRYREGSQYRDADDVVNWDLVNAVEVEVLVRAECPEARFVNNRTFSMGDLATPYGPADGFRRQLFTAVATLRNRG